MGTTSKHSKNIYLRNSSSNTPDSFILTQCLFNIVIVLRIDICKRITFNHTAII